MISLNITVPKDIDFNLSIIAPDAVIISKIRDLNLGRYYLIEVDEETAMVISLMLGKENVWKR